MGHRNRQNQPVSGRSLVFLSSLPFRSADKPKWFPQRKKIKRIKRRYIPHWTSLRRSLPVSFNSSSNSSNRFLLPPRVRLVSFSNFHFFVFVFLVKSTDDNVSPILHLLIQRVKPVINAELVQQIKTTFQFEIATLGQFYLDLKNGSSANFVANDETLHSFRQWSLCSRPISVAVRRCDDQSLQSRRSSSSLLGRTERTGSSLFKPTHYHRWFIARCDASETSCWCSTSW